MAVAFIGRKVKGKLLPVDVNILNISMPNKVYEVQAQTSPVQNHVEAVEALASTLPVQVPGLRVLYVEVGDTSSVVQVTAGDPFSWAILLAALPQILSYVGITLITIAAFIVIGAVPMWSVYLALAGGFLFFIVPKLFPPRGD